MTEARQVYNARTRRWEREGEPVSEARPDGEERLMPFGKYAGEPLSEIPSGYLHWLLTDCELDEDLYADVETELENR